MEEKENKKRKKSKIGAVNILLFAILIILGLAVCTYVGYKIGFEYGSQVGKVEPIKEENNTEKEKESKPKYEVPTGLTEDSQIVKDLMDTFMKDSCYIDYSKLDDVETRMGIASNWVTKSEVLCKNLELKYFYDEDNTPYVCNGVIDTEEAQFKFDETRLTDEKTVVIDANELKAKYEKIFGLNTYKNADFRFFIYYFKYDSKNNRYVRYYIPRSGGTCSGGEDLQSKSVSQTGNDLAIVLQYKTFEETYNFTFEEETQN